MIGTNKIINLLDKLGYVGGIFLGLIILIIIYTITMILYFIVRKRNTNKKVIVEVATLFFVVLFCIVIRLIVLLKTHSCNGFGQGILYLFESLYSGIGRLFFYGIEIEKKLPLIYNILYFGSSIYCVLVFLSIITAKASYEIYSYIMLRLPFNKKVYIFNSITQDTLILANSIKAKERKAKIIFSGEGFGAFDKSNPLHREIMSKNYIYLEYFKPNNLKKEVSVIKRLKKYSNNNILNNKITKDPKKEIHIFAFDNNKILSGLESKNSAFVFNEIELLTKEYIKSRKNGKRPIVNFYILSDNNINYGFYENEVINRIKKVCNNYIKNKQKEIIGTFEKIIHRKIVLKEGQSLTLDNKVYEEFAHHFQLHVINEAVVSSRCLFEKKLETFNYGDYVKEKSNEKHHRVMVLGFGQKGEESMKQLYISEAYVDKDDISNKFIADIFDYNADELGGLFKINHPLFQCSFSNDQNCIDTGKIDNIYEEMRKYYNDNFALIKDKMNFPITCFHKISCFDNNFIDNQLNKLDVLEEYDSIVITLGDDEKNISYVNSILNVFKCNFPKSVKFPTIYVNIRDENNYCRINWNKVDEKEYENIKVIIYGSRIDLYSYEKIIDYSGAIVFNSCYNAVSENKLGELNDFLHNENSQITNIISKIDEKYLDKDYLENKKQWLMLSFFKKMSSLSVDLFSKQYVNEKYFDKETLIALSQIEHNRWNRFHIAEGFVPHINNKSTYKKYHNCLTIFDNVAADNKTYDAINIIVANIMNDKNK